MTLVHNLASSARQLCECGGELRVRMMLFDDRYGYPGTHALLKCEGCGHHRLATEMSAEEIGDLYTNYYPRSSFDVETWSPPREEGRLRLWWSGLKASAFRWVPRDVTILDIGCGFGESLGYHRARGCDAHGIEADRNILRVAERHGINVRAGLFAASCYAPEQFDVVTLDQVIEHAADPISLLRDVRRVLKPGGQAIISTPNPNGWGARMFGRRWIHWHAPYHLNYFTRRSMMRTAATVGFEVESTRVVTNSAWIDYQWAHIATFPRQGRPSPFWGNARRSVLQRIALKIFRLIGYTGVNHVIARLADACGVGDNIVYVLRK